ncbi:UNVERIFIED_CONTAM: hypothetical protein Sangu_1943600 [Sesamum angustifolium]|uniref:Tyrosine specific protein phosphatases domain-containing protein n=1 Tax=Sesamum angustifolium TaxID=2727405 RepID=A0AAW2LY65_9LAMI
MGLLRRLWLILGITRNGEQRHHHHDAATAYVSTPRKDSSTLVERDQNPPLLVFCHAGDGGVQGLLLIAKVLKVKKGLRWYARNLRIDEDGDVADEFLDEVSQICEKTWENTIENYQD